MAFLHAHGISVVPEGLGELLQEAVGRLHRTLYPADPRDDLPVDEAQALVRGGFDLEPRPESSADALNQTAVEFAAVLATSMSTKEVAARLGVATSRVRQRLGSKPRSLYGIRFRSSWRIPEFQFAGDNLLPGLGFVVARLDPELNPVAVQRWFLSPHTDLVASDIGVAISPRDWLRMGHPADVVAELAASI